MVNPSHGTVLIKKEICINMSFINFTIPPELHVSHKRRPIEQNSLYCHASSSLMDFRWTTQTWRRRNDGSTPRPGCNAYRNLVPDYQPQITFLQITIAVIKHHRVLPENINVCS
ncbi:UNVERIFIED_CONTAM: hypothetical protein PYX00_003858 [Menopon gallinae]|uniref:Uncharacterized protein n=1 Tax=Menopon gallinae TaxID=328185 RepID=A0AAW2I279_9NEOP